MDQFEPTIPHQPIQQLQMAATYRPSDGSCESHLLTDELQNCPIMATENGHQVRASPSRIPSAGAQFLIKDTTRRRSTLTESLMERLTTSGKNNCLLNYLLAASLATSVLNTLLLSFIVKSIQLSDKGLLNGRLSWDENLASVVLELPAKLARGSISLRTIESLGDTALRVHKLPAHQTAQADNHARGQPGAGPQLANSRTPLVAANQIGSRAIGSYIDVSDGELELGASSFTMDQLLFGQAVASSNRQLGQRQSANVSGHSLAGQQVGDGLVRRRLIEFDGERQSITMPMVSELQLSPTSSNSISILGELSASQLIGSLDENLDVQTRDGQLKCRSERTVNLVSKSSSVRLTSSDNLKLSAALISFGGVGATREDNGQADGPVQRLYLGAKLEYFDEEPGEAAKQMTRSDGVRAYNLVAINGLLMAA